MNFDLELGAPQDTSFLTCSGTLLYTYSAGSSANQLPLTFYFPSLHLQPTLTLLFPQSSCSLAPTLYPCTILVDFATAPSMPTLKPTSRTTSFVSHYKQTERAELIAQGRALADAVSPNRGLDEEMVTIS